LDICVYVFVYALRLLGFFYSTYMMNKGWPAEWVGPVAVIKMATISRRRGMCRPTDRAAALPAASRGEYTHSHGVRKLSTVFCRN